jgi:UDP-N-acetylglucosamine 2-epimerase
MAQKFIEELELPTPNASSTEKRLQENNMLAKMQTLRIVLIFPPLGNLDFLVPMSKCRLTITDSGDIQEEGTAPGIRKLLLVMRLSTERPEAA